MRMITPRKRLTRRAFLAEAGAAAGTLVLVGLSGRMAAAQGRRKKAARKKAGRRRRKKAGSKKLRRRKKASGK